MAEPVREGVYARHLKRPLDILGAALLLLPALPLLALAALGVWLTLGRPVLFRQCRSGRDGVPFTLLKLRSMRPSPAGAAFDPATDAVRLTRFGRWLRASALDELPQLWNILRGEMSLVGPRPLPPDYLPLYSPRQRIRLRVRPGLLGLAQARGRNALGWTERLEWDARYAVRVTFLGDVAAAAGSLAVLLRGRGTRSPGHATSAPLSAGATDSSPPAGMP
ncbi:sugar transferase [Roseomonas sp. OT10]|uniref:sugar transferase n=1 Tax=Roseomonas cutis TaxID=2897332 RepID=UPI001E61ACA5|nr:sugar transferase [Roseomonas sp. OT10]UFN50496.1 sugar transferase [Roseomonas sp. OT10]